MARESLIALCDVLAGVALRIAAIPKRLIACQTLFETELEIALRGLASVSHG